MLQQLRVKNYALIRDLDISFKPGFNIITGETGAGKSILLGALGLVLGDRADTKVMQNQDQKCVIEVQFQTAQLDISPLLESWELDVEPVLLLRREIAPGGKSRAFINDTPVQLSQLKTLGDLLVNIHSQHETLLLNNSGFQLRLLDQFAGSHALFLEYQQLFNAYSGLNRQLKMLEEKEAEALRDKDYYSFLYQELSDANPLAGELEQLEALAEQLANAGEIAGQCGQAVQLLLEGDQPVVDQLQQIRHQLQPLGKSNGTIQEICERIQGLTAELKELGNDLRDIGEQSVGDPAKLEEINNRLNQLNSLFKKHKVNTTDELLQLKQTIGERLANMDSVEEERAEVARQLEQQLKNLVAKADQLSGQRSQGVSALEDAINKQLQQVGMPHAQVRCQLQRITEAAPGSAGWEQVQLEFSANKGFPFQPIHKVASGGELSRLMLVIKAQLARSADLPTIIFDEVDTGISGEIALKVAGVMKQLAANRQVIAISHLPQVAASGTTHFFVYKDHSGDQTNTAIRQLAAEERVAEIAKMLSGDQPTANALQAARELMEA